MYTFGTGAVTDEILESRQSPRCSTQSPAAINKDLTCANPFTATKGLRPHWAGRIWVLPVENRDKVDALEEAKLLP